MSYRLTNIARCTAVKYLTYQGSLSDSRDESCYKEIIIKNTRTVINHLSVENNISNINNNHEKQE